MNRMIAILFDQFLYELINGAALNSGFDHT